MPKFNADNFRKVLDQIKAHTRTWNQDRIHCGSAHCFMGWAQIMSGKPLNRLTARVDGRVWLGLSYDESLWLFSSDRNLQDFERVLADGSFSHGCRHSDGYDCHGFNLAGYDRDGYNRDGYDCDGYTRDGYNRDGYNRDGYNRDGYDRDGFNRAGYDRDGLDSDNNPRPS